MSEMQPALHRLGWLATLMGVGVVILGVWVRLSDAGLGCPDWPGCYGQLLVPETEQAIAQANAAFPERPVEIAKAWKEMLHRYVAAGLGLLILIIAVMAELKRQRFGGLLLLLVALVVFQGILGMWTVTLLVKPLIVTAHLLSGFITVALLWWFTLRSGGLLRSPAEQLVFTQSRQIRPWCWLGLGLLLSQIALGGWTSSNYAALACPDLPRCLGEWWPAMDVREGFVLWRGLGIDYEGGVLTHPARVAIHVMHRVGALVTVTYWAIVVLWIVFGRFTSTTQMIAWSLLCLLGVQIGLGASNVLLGLPLGVAVAHNAIALGLLLAVTTLLHSLYRHQQ